MNRPGCVTSCSGTVSVTGPMGNSIVDMALFYSVIAGPHAPDPYSINQTPVSVPALLTPYLDGVRIGVDWKWAKQVENEDKR
jgi:Asp-tRNA(Asn)/Glu-tRNA(Gln) amidotransferase A subunit family amidase